MLLASIDRFEARYGDSDEKAEQLLEDASDLILSEVAGSTEGWLTDETKVPSVVAGICVTVAYRAWSNPDSLSSESLGQHTQAWADRSGEALRLTASECRIVRREAGLGSFNSLTLESPYSGPVSESDLAE